MKIYLTQYITTFKELFRKALTKNPHSFRLNTFSRSILVDNHRLLIAKPIKSLCGWKAFFKANEGDLANTNDTGNDYVVDIKERGTACCIKIENRESRIRDGKGEKHFHSLF